MKFTLKYTFLAEAKLRNFVRFFYSYTCVQSSNYQDRILLQYNKVFIHLRLL